MKASILVILVSLMALSGCKQSSDVAGNGLVQKRKYRPGLSINSLRIKHFNAKPNPKALAQNLSNTPERDNSTQLLTTDREEIRFQEEDKFQEVVNPTKIPEAPHNQMIRDKNKKAKLTVNKGVTPIHLKTHPIVEEPVLNKKELNRTRLKIIISALLMIAGAALVLISFSSIFLAFSAPLWMYLLYGFGPLISPIFFAVSTMFLIANLNRYERIKKGMSAISSKNKYRHTRHRSMSPILSVVLIGLMVGLAILFMQTSMALIAGIAMIGFLMAFLGYFALASTGLFSQISNINTEQKDWLSLIIHVLQLLLFIAFVGFLRIFLRLDYESNAG